MKYTEFAENIRAIYAEKFPNSVCKVEAVKNFGKYIFITCSLAENINECANRIAMNDMFHIQFCITLNDNFNFESDKLPEQMALECRTNNYLIIPENKYLCYSRRKISYRKVTGTAEKLEETFKKFIDKLYNQLIEDYNGGNIHKDFKEIVQRYSNFYTE